MDALIEFGKILIPASVVLYAAYLIVRSFIQKEVDLKKLEVRSRSIETVLPSRLQAYERMALFLERMSPQNLLVRLNTSKVSSYEFHQLLLMEIRNEYNHNVSQQIYVSEDVWNMIRNAKEDLIVTINESANEMFPEASSLDLAKKIFEKTINKQIDPLAHALTELKREIQRTF
jgi:predicted AlkP superfamily phosphohydrolase/phosphomutase